MIFLWIDENNPLEPVHVHIAKGKPAADATKVWITRAGRCLLQNSHSWIPGRELRVMMRIAETRSADVIRRRTETFVQIDFCC